MEEIPQSSVEGLTTKDCHWFVYLVTCSDGSLYCGIAKNVDKRIAQHNTGKGAKYTRSRLPVSFLIKVEVPTQTEALIREREIKKLKRDHKVAYFIRLSKTHKVYINF